MSKYAKDIFNNIRSYSDLVMSQWLLVLMNRVDGLLQTCCIIYRVWLETLHDL